MRAYRILPFKLLVNLQTYVAAAPWVNNTRHLTLSILSRKDPKSLENCCMPTCGKMSQTSLGGAHYYLLIKDDCTSYRFVSFLKAKGEAIRFFLKVLRYIERTTGNQTKTLRTDRGGEFCSTEFDLLLEQEGIVRETSTPYTP